jgi:hypothetical protein
VRGTQCLDVKLHDHPAWVLGQSICKPYAVEAAYSTASDLVYCRSGGTLMDDTSFRCRPPATSDRTGCPVSTQNGTRSPMFPYEQAQVARRFQLAPVWASLVFLLLQRLPRETSYISGLGIDMYCR